MSALGSASAIYAARPMRERRNEVSGNNQAVAEHRPIPGARYSGQFGRASAPR
jgi:hypothetical protein